LYDITSNAGCEEKLAHEYRCDVRQEAIRTAGTSNQPLESLLPVSPYSKAEKKSKTHLEEASPVYCTTAKVEAAAIERTPRATAVRPLLVLAGPEDQMSDS